MPVARRDAFLQRVTKHLTGEPSDEAVSAAVNAALDGVPVFLHAMPNRKEKAHDDIPTSRPHRRGQMKPSMRTASCAMAIRCPSRSCFATAPAAVPPRRCASPTAICSRPARPSRRSSTTTTLRPSPTPASRFVDGHGRPAGHRPGFCIPTDPALIRGRAAVRDAYREAEERDANAWREPTPWAGAAAVPAEMPDRLSADALQMLDEKERAYREAALADENAWRNPRDEQRPEHHT